MVYYDKELSNLSFNSFFKPDVLRPLFDNSAFNSDTFNLEVSNLVVS